jgi:HlyD family secretion protein
MTNQRRVFRRPGLRVVLTVAGLLATIGVLAWLAFRTQSNAPARQFELIYPRRATLIATVNASGQIQPAQLVNVSFASPGRVDAVLVQVGEQVLRGAALARLETRELEIRLAQAQAQLRQAEANRQKLLAGASPAELALAEAQLRQAQAQLRQTTGGLSSADLAAAEAQLEQARTILSAAQAGADPTELKLAETQLEQSRAQFDQQRDQLSAAKTNAELAVQTAANALVQAQARYATAKENWEYVQATGNDPVNRSVADPARPGRTRPNKLNDAQQRQYYDAFVQAEANLRSAENSLQQSQVSAENARQAEVNGIRVAEQQVANAQTRRDQVQAGASPDQLAAARAQVATAQANLNRLRGDQRTGALAAAQSAVEQAQARLEQLRADPQPGDLELIAAQVESAQAARDLAQLAFDQATLRAPFAGTVAEVNLKAGEVAGATRPAVVLTDLSSFFIDVLVDEIDISRLAVSQPVTLTLDALPGVTLPGDVQSVAPLAAAQAAVTSYQVRIGARVADQRVRPGMSASADIVVARKPDALLVPRRAVRNDRGRLVVDVTRDQTICTLPPEQRPGRPELEQRPVRTGLSNELLIEVVEGLDEQTCVYVEGIDARLRFFQAGGPSPGVRPR